MSPLLLTQTRPELLWAEQQFDNGVATVWRFSSEKREVSLSLMPLQMQAVNPDGQWVLADIIHQGGMFQLCSVVSLPQLIDKQKLTQQLALVSEEQKPLLEEIWSMLAYIEGAALRDFLLEVLMNDSIMVPFCQGQGSHRHHHDELGGLLAHSHEVAMTAAMLCNKHQLGGTSVWVAFVGGLLHDIGKIRLYYNQPSGMCVQHESYNFMLLADPLDRLSVRAPKIFEALSACLSVKVGQHGEPYQVASIVRMCDRISAEVSNWRRAFTNVPDYYWYAKSPLDNQLYKRLG
ncbi:HDIG domain-containing metalloprotein [Oceanisphaera pacifica]|uniref:HDIG domain-containing protein n=1 Tax=Oceanisphaera pacifica TaxID=2818389 RepID=A0ABS3NJV5_9GAMM|nr:HDIG domain-containing metalloprotein [Oceanisphaera pacifica]MBO1520698.1 HDIG domain-containing protein [Oceanisphaera pacifica]